MRPRRTRRTPARLTGATPARRTGPTPAERTEPKPARRTGPTPARRTGPTPAGLLAASALLSCAATSPAWRPTTPADALGGWPFQLRVRDAAYRTSYAYDIGVDGTVRYRGPGGDGTGAPVAQLGADFVVRHPTTRDPMFRLDAADGTLTDLRASPGLPPDLACHLTDAGHLHCRHGDTGAATTFAVRSGAVTAIAGDPWLGLAGGRVRVDPWPENTAQHRTVLFLFSMLLIEEDTRSHDGDLDVHF